jgi:putative flippase GtrA
LTVKAEVFAVVGIINTLIDVNVFAIAYGIFGIPLIPANLLAWFLQCHFRMQRMP